MSKKRPDKILNLLEKIDKCLESGRYLETAHAQAQMRKRGIIRPEVQFILKHGHHEKKKDEFVEAYSTWNYAIRDQTIDGRNLRIVVSFDEPGLLVITAIDLDH